LVSGEWHSKNWISGKHSGKRIPVDFGKLELGKIDFWENGFREIGFGISGGYYQKVWLNMIKKEWAEPPLSPLLATGLSLLQVI